MRISEEQSTEKLKQAEDVGRMLADAFIERVERFPSTARTCLLLACRERLLQNERVAELLLNAHAGVAADTLQQAASGRVAV